MVLFVALTFVPDYYCPDWSDYKVIDIETYSPMMSIITIRTTTPDAKWWQEGRSLEIDTRRFRSLWKRGPWTLMLSDHMGKFPRMYGNVASYTPLPPLKGQSPAKVRILVHMEEDDDAATKLVNEKASKKGAFIRMASQPWIWTKHHARIPNDIQQAVIFASGPTGIAPMLQTIHTLLEARKGDGIVRRTPDIHVVWFRHNPKPAVVDADGSSQSHNQSTADEIAGRELERLHLLHPDRLVVESIDAENMFIHGQAVNAIESSRQSSKLLLISGSTSLSEYLSGYREGRSHHEDGPSILTKATQAGWRILDFSATKVCN